MDLIVFLPIFFVCLTSIGYSIDPNRVTQLSWKPRVFLYEGFLSNEECDHLIMIAKDKLGASRVRNRTSGNPVLSKVRTSSGMFLDPNQDEVGRKIEQRIAAWTFLPSENGEWLQILRYKIDQKYEPHHDFNLKFGNDTRTGGHRLATVIIYLSNVEKGGRTVFPYLEEAPKLEENDYLTECERMGFSVKPKKGNALLFFDLKTDNTPDPLSLHGSCPVVEGEKWSATKWIHVAAYPHRTNSDQKCVDDNEMCALWASLGECQKNPKYMVGQQGILTGRCRKSCGVCT